MTDTTPIARAEDLIGRFVIARCIGAGVHAGTLVSIDGEQGVTLTGSRRLWRWWAAKSAFLSGVAVHGLSDAKGKESRVGEAVDIALRDVCELIPCSDTAAASIREYRAYEPD